MRTGPLLRAIVLGTLTSLWVAASATEAMAQPAATATAADVKKASAHFNEGSRLFEFKRFPQALDHFKKSYAFVPSPNSHLYIARCLAVLDQPFEAYLEFDKVIAEAEDRIKAGEDKYAPTLESAKGERDELAPKIAFVTIDVRNPAPGAVLTIRGQELAREKWGKPVPLAPGEAQVILESASNPAISQSLTLAAGDAKSVTLGTAPTVTTPLPDKAPASSPQGRGWLRPYAYVAAGAGVAGLAAFTAAGSMSNATFANLEQTCRGPCPANRADDVSAGKTEQTVANIGLIVGALGVAAGVTLFVVSHTPERTEKAGRGERARPSRMQAASSRLVVGSGYVGVRSQF